METLWNISTLAAQVALRLNELGYDQRSGRVTEAPSSRTIRYYATHGLIDPPTRYNGRTALYGARHLLQLVAIKRLQSIGRSLTDIQQTISGVTDEVLAELAGTETASASDEKETGVETTKREDFWKAPISERRKSDVQSVLSEVEALKLAAGVTLVLDDAQIVEGDLELIRAAAEPLVALLKQRRIIRP